jgi:hypothetical protein
MAIAGLLAPRIGTMIAAILVIPAIVLGGRGLPPVKTAPLAGTAANALQRAATLTGCSRPHVPVLSVAFSWII